MRSTAPIGSRRTGRTHFRGVRAQRGRRRAHRWPRQAGRRVDSGRREGGAELPAGDGQCRRPQLDPDSRQRHLRTGRCACKGSRSRISDEAFRHHARLLCQGRRARRTSWVVRWSRCRRTQRRGRRGASFRRIAAITACCARPASRPCWRAVTPTTRCRSAHARTSIAASSRARPWRAPRRPRWRRLAIPASR
jgi:hypothetical protein